MFLKICSSFSFFHSSCQKFSSSFGFFKLLLFSRCCTTFLFFLLLLLPLSIIFSENKKILSTHMILVVMDMLKNPNSFFFSKSSLLRLCTYTQLPKGHHYLGVKQASKPWHIQNCLPYIFTTWQNFIPELTVVLHYFLIISTG